MSLSFFGKGFGSLGWTVISDTSPKGMVGLNGALFNLIGNLAGITTPIIIGYLVKKTGSFDDVLIFVGATALCAIVSYGPIVGEIKRLDISLQATTAAPAKIEGNRTSSTPQQNSKEIGRKRRAKPNERFSLHRSANPFIPGLTNLVPKGRLNLAQDAVLG